MAAASLLSALVLAKRFNESGPFAVIVVADHSGNQECIDQDPDETDKHEVAEDLKNGSAGTSEIKAMAADVPSEKPEKKSCPGAFAGVGYALFDQHQFFCCQFDIICHAQSPLAAQIALPSMRKSSADTS